MNKLNKVTLTAATCGLDLGDGSEREIGKSTRLNSSH